MEWVRNQILTSCRLATTRSDIKYLNTEGQRETERFPG